MAKAKDPITDEIVAAEPTPVVLDEAPPEPSPPSFAAIILSEVAASYRRLASCNDFEHNRRLQAEADHLEKVAKGL